MVDAQLLDVAGPDETDTIRYRFHDLLRALSREHLSREPATEQVPAMQRLIGAYLTLVAHAEELFQPGEVRKTSSYPRWPVDTSYMTKILRDPVAWVIAERASLVACIEQAFHANLWEGTWELAHILAPFFEMLAYWDDWERTHALALEAARRSGNGWAQAIIIFDLAALDRDRGRLDDALGKYELALTGFTEAGDRHGEAVAYLGQGIIFRNKNEWIPAAEHLITSLEILRTTGDRRLTAQALRSLAIVRGGQLAFDESIRYFREALQVFRELGDRRAEAYGWRGLAKVWLDKHNLREAKDSYEASLTLTRALRDRRGEGRALQGLGRVCVAQSAAVDAFVYYAQAMRLAEDVGDTTLISELRGDISACHTCHNPDLP